jgi:hypothetical protein
MPRARRSKRNSKPPRRGPLALRRAGKLASGYALGFASPRPPRSGQFICYKTGQFYLLPTALPGVMVLFLVTDHAVQHRHVVSKAMAFQDAAYILQFASATVLPAMTQVVSGQAHCRRAHAVPRGRVYAGAAARPHDPGWKRARFGPVASLDGHFAEDATMRACRSISPSSVRGWSAQVSRALSPQPVFRSQSWRPRRLPNARGNGTRAFMRFPRAT